MKKKALEEGWLSPVPMMEIVICDSELSQLSFSTISAHSWNVQPSSKEKKASNLRG